MASEAVAPQSNGAVRKRIPGLDALRGLFLVLMTVTHLPTRFNVYSHDALGFVSAAEGFVFLSAFLVGYVHVPALRERGASYVRKALWRRSLELYGAHLALLLLAFLLAAGFAHRPALYNVLSFFVDEPSRALVAAPLLVYRPPMFDILPMYAVFLALTPLALSLADRRGALAMLVPSALVWTLAQCGMRQQVQAFVGSLWGGLPDHVFGAFDLFAWQLLWCLGLTLGASKRLQALLAGPLPRYVSWGAGAVCIGFLALRYGERIFGLAASAPAFLDKWRLAPLRLVNLAAWLIVLVQMGPRLVQIAMARALRLLGRASLPVFCAHLLIALGAFLLVDDADSGLELWQELLVVVVGFALLFAVASRRMAVQLIAPSTGPWSGRR